MRTRTPLAAVAAALIAAPACAGEIAIRCGADRYRLDTERNSLTDGRQAEAVDWKYDGEWLRLHLRKSDKDVAFSTSDGALISGSTRVALGCVFENPEALAALPLSEGALLRRAFIAYPEPLRRAMQETLARDGFYSGTADGLWGKGTEAAVLAFARSMSLDPRRETDVKQAVAGLLPAEVPAAGASFDGTDGPAEPVAAGTPASGFLALLSPNQIDQMQQSAATWKVGLSGLNSALPQPADALIGIRLDDGKLSATLAYVQDPLGISGFPDLTAPTLLHASHTAYVQSEGQDYVSLQFDDFGLVRGPSNTYAGFQQDRARLSVRLASVDGWKTHSGTWQMAAGPRGTWYGALLGGEPAKLQAWVAEEAVSTLRRKQEAEVRQREAKLRAEQAERQRQERERRVTAEFRAQYDAAIAGAKDSIGFRDLKIGLPKPVLDVLTAGFAEIEGVRVTREGSEKVCDLYTPGAAGSARCYGLDYRFSWRIVDSKLAELVVNAGSYAGSGSFVRDTLNSVAGNDQFAEIYHALSEKYELAYRFGENERNLFNLGELDGLYVAFEEGRIVLAVERPSDSRPLEIKIIYSSDELGRLRLDQIRPKTAVSDF